jgi:hypothetical protein
MLENEYSLNKEIHKWEDDPLATKTVPLFEDDKVKLYYTKQHTKDENSNCYCQQDVLAVELKDKGITITHKPHLDPYVSFEENIVCMTSDGECWVCDTNTGKENSIDMPIVAFDHYIDFDADQRRIILNTFVVSGTGCYWGCEAYEQGFEIYIDKDTLEEKEQDVWDEEEGYEAYRQSLEDDE